MSETKISLEEARSKIEKLRLRNARDGAESLYSVAKDVAYHNALSILSHVEAPSEEDRAVLWLMKCPHTWTKTIGYDDENDVWYALYLDDESKPGIYVLKLINPADEAKKRGWGG